MFSRISFLYLLRMSPWMPVRRSTWARANGSNIVSARRRSATKPWPRVHPGCHCWPCPFTRSPKRSAAVSPSEASDSCLPPRAPPALHMTVKLAHSVALVPFLDVRHAGHRKSDRYW